MSAGVGSGVGVFSGVGPDGVPARARVLVIDNYDSFTYNLVQILQELGAEVVVYRNDAIDVAGIAASGLTHLVVSPGPGGPREAGVSMAAIGAMHGVVPVLGVCLGHQAMSEVFGGRVGPAGRLMHGKASEVGHDGRGVFAGLPARVQCGRYHSLAVPEGGVPAGFEVTATTEQGEIMGMRHGTEPTEGVQFHPESVLTPEGRAMLENFLRAGGPGGGKGPR